MNNLAQITPGFVGADLQALVNKASTYAVKRIFAKISQNRIENVKEVMENKDNEDKIPNGENSNEEIVKESDVVVTDNVLEPSIQDSTTEAVNSQETDHGSGIIESVQKAPEIEIKPIDPVDEVLSLLENTHPYTSEQLSGLAIIQEDFLKALKTTKPCAVREGIVTVPDVTWDDVGSLNQVRKDLQLAVLAPVKYPEQLKKLGLSSPTGVNFISVKGPELLNMYVGESERAVRTCFRRARNSAPCVIFFDEFDALCPRRSSHDNNGAARVVNQLLTEMDGIESREGVFVLAASNRPDIIDPAVLRPGRLDRIMYVGMPATEDRYDILQKLTKGGTKPSLSPDVDLRVIADVTEGYTGADLSGLVRAAATYSLTNHIANGTLDGEIFVSFEDFRSALSKCKPSISQKEQLHYEKLRIKYSGSIYERDMLMETEPTNEESMDTV
ncbi:smallminded [Danaus plexippus plexippus]|uniref:Smallminded n=1 Tax=Danaus plexippus plexippus TaxID=278856 RepID=A0A212FHL0_DANPL|nr:smallminded [Danaus plexippus plexippus]